MSSPRFPWWGFARNMIRCFPSLERTWNDLHEQSVTANMSGMPRGGGAGRTVETVAMRQLSPDYQKMYDAVVLAREHTMLMPNGSDRLKLIRVMYWSKKTLTIKDAAIHIPVSESTAKRWHKEFVLLVGRCYGFKDDTYEPK